MTIFNNSLLIFPQQKWWVVLFPQAPQPQTRGPVALHSSSACHVFCCVPKHGEFDWDSGLIAWINTITAWWFFAYPSEKWWTSSLGMMTFPIYGKVKKNVPHQPVMWRVLLGSKIVWSIFPGFNRDDAWNNCPENAGARRNQRPIGMSMKCCEVHEWTVGVTNEIT